jgi:hypothetical protein
MPTEQQEARPKRMHGIVPTPYEIPSELKPAPAKPRNPRPLMITIVSWYFFARAVVSLLLAIVPWGDPDSAVANYLTASPSLFGMLPRSFRPNPLLGHATQTNFVQALPFVFLATAVLFGLLAWKLWTLSNRWRWATMFWSAYALFSTVRFVMLDTMVRSVVDIPLPPLPEQVKLALFANVVWNLLILCYLAFYPGVKQAFEGS